jgi:hypothetical protein
MIPMSLRMPRSPFAESFPHRGVERRAPLRCDATDDDAEPLPEAERL